jgi:hypothetical protein
MSAQWHPDAEAIARYQAGLLSGSRGRRLAAHVAGCARCASVSDQLARVGPALVSVPATPMPDAVERQITAALAVEAATRPAGASPAGAQPADARPRRLRRLRRPRVHRLRLALAVVPAVACLLLGGLVYMLSQLTSSPSSSSAASAGAAASAPSAFASAAHGTASAPSSASGLAPAAGTPAFGTGLKPLDSGPVPFVVVESGTAYHKGTLGAQVRGELNVSTSQSPGRSPAAGGNRPAGGGARLAPSQGLVGCVRHLTGSTHPRLVDLATYQGQPAYVIAVTGRVWVVGLGCTASHPALITSAPLPPPSAS